MDGLVVTTSRREFAIPEAATEALRERLVVTADAREVRAGIDLALRLGEKVHLTREHERVLVEILDNWLVATGIDGMGAELFELRNELLDEIERDR